MVLRIKEEKITADGIVTFESGGIHPQEKKYLSKDRSIKPADLPERVIIPLVQHIGRPAVPIVKVGDCVKTGQMIAESGGFISAAVHSSISGTVKSIERFPHPLGKKVLSIEIESDGKDEKDLSLQCLSQDSVSSDEIIERIQKTGIVGLGGAAFPTHIKLMPPKEKTVDTVIINGAECEPYLTCDYRNMLENSDDVLLGLKLIMKATGVKDGIIAIESNKPYAFRKITEVIQKKYPDMKAVITEVKYPQGAEKQLINAVLERIVPSGGLPFDVGVIVQNVGTAIAIKESVLDGKPLYERVVSLTGEGTKKPSNWRVRIGTLMSDLLEKAGGIIPKPYKIIMGGPMMGIAQSRLDVPVIKGTSGILILNNDQADNGEYHACIRCNRCIRACPMKLMPSVIGTAVEHTKIEIARKHDISDCIECGCCSYVCPSKRPLVQFMKFGKLSIALEEAGQ